MEALTKLLNFTSPVLKKITDFFKPVISFLSNTKSIRTKLILAFSVPILLIIIQGVISYSNTSSTATKLAIQASITSMENSGKYLDVVLRTIDNLGGQIFTDTDVQNYLSGSYDQEDIFAEAEIIRKVESRLMNISTFSSDISNIMIIASKENTASLSSSNTTSVKLDRLKDSINLKQLEETKTGSGWFGVHEDLDKLTDSTTGKYSLSSMRLIRSISTMETIGLLVIDIKPEVVTSLIKSINLARNQQIHLVSPDGRVITNGLDSGKNSSLTKQKFYTDLVAGKNTKGSGRIMYEGTKYLMTYYKITSTGYVLLGFIPDSELNIAARQVVITTVIMIVLAGLIAFGTGIFMANSMSRTINGIITASGKAASGDLSATFDSKRQDELGTLTKSINSMIGSMRCLIEQTLGVSEKVSKSALTVSSTSQHVSSVSQDISRAIQEISQGASAQAADAEHGVEKISFLAERINKVTENAKSIDNLTRDTMKMTQNGLASVEDLDVKANRTTAISKEIMVDIQGLDVHSKSIGKIVKVIRSIADQTNLLALNATIEAARAGEMGKGFAVVADEVRKLAEQSMNATREIASIIKSTQDQTAKAVEKAATTESILKSQNDAVLSTIGIFKSIMNSMETLSVQVEQIMSRISEMEDNKEQAINSIQNISAVSEETAASSEEVTASTQEQLASIEELARYADELEISAKDLQQSISRFKLDE